MASEHPQSSGPGVGPGFRPIAPNWPDGASGPRPRKTTRLRTLLVSAVVFILVASGIGTALVVFLKTRGTGDVLAKLAPSNTAFYMSIYLDPPASQKTNFNNLLHRFPDVRDDTQRDKKVNDVIDGALKTSHLNHNDVKSWLGSQLSIIAPDDILGVVRGGPSVGRATATTPAGGELPFAVLISSTDDGKAQSALGAFRSGADGQKYSWNDDSHDGVPVARGVPRSGSGGTPIVYATVDHAAVVSASPALTNDIIDTAHGKRPALDSVDRYKKALSGLPGEHLALAYVDVQAAVSQVRGRSGSDPGAQGSSTPPPAGLDAFQGLALSLSAQPNGFAVDGGADFDPAKLTDEQRRLLETRPGANSVVSMVPARAYGFLALTGLNQAAASAVKALGDIDPSISSALEQFGVTGPDGIVSHLTGNVAAEASPHTGSMTPGGALLLGTNDDAVMARFLGKVADLAAQGGSRPSPSSAMPYSTGSMERAPGPAQLAVVTPTPGPRITPRPIRASPSPTPRSARVTPGLTPTPAPAVGSPVPTPAPDRSVHHVETTYRGTVITTAQVNGADPRGLLPTYAVSHGVGILATSVDEVKAVIDAQSGTGVTSAPGYRSAIDQAQKDNTGILYVDLASVEAAVRDALAGSNRANFDSLAPNLAPLKTFLFTSQVSANRATVRMFLGIG